MLLLFLLLLLLPEMRCRLVGCWVLHRPVPVYLERRAWAQVRSGHEVRLLTEGEKKQFRREL